MFINLIRSLIVGLLFYLSFGFLIEAFNNRSSNRTSDSLLIQKAIRQQSVPLFVNSTITSSSVDGDPDNVKSFNFDSLYRLKSIGRSNQSVNGVNSKWKLKQNQSLYILLSSINPFNQQPSLSSQLLFKQHPGYSPISTGKLLASLRSSDDSPDDHSMAKSVDWSLVEDKNEMSKDATYNGEEDNLDDESGDSEEDLMIDDDEDYSNEMYVHGNMDEVKSSNDSSLNRLLFDDSNKTISESNDHSKNHTEGGKLNSIVPISDSNGGPLILSKASVERFEPRQKSLRFPLMMPRSSHRNGSRTREGCSLRSTEFPKSKTTVIYWRPENA